MQNRKQHRLAQRRFRAKHPHGQRRYVLKRRYGITLEEYNRLFKIQGGVCAICRKPELVELNGKVLALAVDHSHSTDSVRGLLCLACNRGLGSFKDSSALLRSAAHYLDNHEVE
jgi:hypothetical protein